MAAMLATVLLVWLASPSMAAAGPLDRLEGEGFAHYTLALTWHPGFCATHSRPPRECREPSLDEGDGLVLHGLWPSLPERFAEQGVDRRRWREEGCFLDAPRAGGSFCRAHPPFDFPEGLETELDEAMPGRESCLDRYQYAKHAACLDLAETDYFAAAVALVEKVEESAFGAFMTLNQGGEVDRNDLVGAFEAAFGEDTGRALGLICRGPGNRLLTEVRIGILAQRLDAFPQPGSLARQAPGRCATRVQIAAF